MSTVGVFSEQCAACGNGGDGLNLKMCAACKMVKYCSVACQMAHRPSHKKACRERADELRDKALFKKPPPREDCPICFLPLPISSKEQHYQDCCGKTVCGACTFFTVKEQVERENHGGQLLCPFCRTPAMAMADDKEYLRRINARMDANDGEAMNSLACKYNSGKRGMPKDHNKAMELWVRASKLGCPAALYNIAAAYADGRGVSRNPRKEKYYHALAAAAGHVQSRSILGTLEWNDGNKKRGCRLWMMAAEEGHDNALSLVKLEGLKRGHVTKDEYERTLRAHKVSADAMKSDQRDEYAKFQSLPAFQQMLARDYRPELML